jgi:myo-inositol 2-dehydrogenase/D-chiro-inositol 1-dehydrogenase
VHSLEPGAPAPPADPYTGFLDRFQAAFAAETEAFVDLVLGRAENPCPPEEALSALRIAVACERGWRERRPVRVEEVVGVGSQGGRP